MTLQFIQADALTGLATLASNSVQCVVCSPPYYALRDYKLDAMVWDADPNCDHVWGEDIPGRKSTGGIASSGLAGWGNGLTADSIATKMTGTAFDAGPSAFCLNCSAWRGQLGLEPSSDLYIQHLTQIFREVNRVLRPDGLLFLNIADSYFGDSPVRNASAQSFSATWNPDDSAGNGGTRRSAARDGDLKPKDLCMIPARVALALQSDGWFLRSDTIEEVELFCPCGCGFVLEEKITRRTQDREVIWSKPNPMPESVDDRPTRSHEYIFILSKSRRYFWDAEAVKENCQSGPSDMRKMSEQRARIGGKTIGATDAMYAANQSTNIGKKRGVGNPNGRNARSVWTIATIPFKDAHFATFPPEIPRRAILAGTSEKGACGQCGSPWARLIKRDSNWPTRKANGEPLRHGMAGASSFGAGDWKTESALTLGWKPSCTCGGYEVKGVGKARHRRLARRLAKLVQPVMPLFDAPNIVAEVQQQKLAEDVERYWTGWQRRIDAKFPAVAPCTVLDCFAGSGTTGEVGEKLRRHVILIEPNPEYAPMIDRRTNTTGGLQFI